MSIQYLSIENCATENERQIFEIMEFYAGVFTGEKAVFISEEMHQETKDWANSIRNEAAAILNSRLQGDDLLVLQATFLSRFFPFYVIGKAKFPTNFDAYFKENVLLGIYTPQQEHDHLLLLSGKYGQGKFVQ